ncbi:MAG: PSD1 and planctomycete cytochrome C domain-containing protein [Planctomycetota bacterium]|nr:PSD1 and planctomycete cytochrome C domain-containing protein [Planctomycetota bacterium]
MLRLRLLIPVIAVVFAALAIPSTAFGWAEQEHSPEQIKFFESEIKPILVQHCVKCHGGKGAPKSGLFLTSRQGLLKGGEAGPSVSLESPRESVLLEAVNYASYEMPPNGKLPQAKIDALTKWVEMGLPWTPGGKIEYVAADEHGPPPVNDETKKFWSFQPVSRPELPQVIDDRWVRTPIDAFVLSGLEQAGLQPVARATKTALLRRAYYDLIGLPPSPDEVQAFLSDDAPDAFERVVDQLLESPHYGERWGRHWLDLVRYAETNSYERDGAKPFVWRYRDYVIRAFNADKPYDQFMKEQIAGDELDKATSDSIIATGYYRLGIWQDEPVDPEQELFEDLDDLVRTTAEVYLGMTVGCARCHDHKLDPIPQTDYYGMLAFFRNVKRLGERSHESVLAASVRTLGTDDAVQRYERLVREHKEATDENRQELGKLDRRIKADLVGVENDEWKAEQARVEIAKTRIGKILTQEEFNRYVALTAERDQLRQFRPPGNEQALCVKEHGRSSPPTHVLIRGNAHVEGDVVEPGFLSVLSPPEPKIVPPAEGVESTGRRLALANWFASRDNPLTARVMVNRIWQYHFGRGIVRSTSDFGFQGIAPTHPELLDWLAAEFVDGEWRMKRLHKLIMLSNTYQMSSQPNEQALAKDPINNLMWRFDMRRLSAEEIRDSILAVNGSLNRDKMFGPSIFVPIPEEVLAGQSRPGDGWGQSSPEDRARRSIYIHVKRSLVVPMMASFDGADTDASCPTRFVTTQPTQALGMLNSDFINEQADVFAKYLIENAGSNIQDQIALGLRRTVQRDPTSDEIERGKRLINTLQQKYQLSPQAALKQFCVTALNFNEFMYLD